MAVIHAAPVSFMAPLPSHSRRPSLIHAPPLSHSQVQPCAAIVDVLPPPCDDVFAANATAFACLLAADDEGASAELYCEQVLAPD